MGLGTWKFLRRVGVGGANGVSAWEVISGCVKLPFQGPSATSFLAAQAPTACASLQKPIKRFFFFHLQLWH